MRFKILTLVAAAALLAACDTTPKATDTGAAAGTANTFTPAATDGTPAAELVQVGDRVFFAFDKSDISGESRAILERQSAFTKKYPQLTFTIEGHCDERGTREYNLALGERRATAAKNALVALGVQASRLQTISYGKERPAVVGSNEAAWAQNRRAVTVIN
jgi:peptidoglycan-associated lipoprotein